MKTALKLIVLIGIAGYLIYAVTRFSQHTEEVVCKGVDIEISDSLLCCFISKDDVYSILTKNKIHAQGKKISEINLSQIEKLMEDNPYIEEAHTYYTGQGILRITVVPQQPILHVMPQKGEGYYLDRNGSTMPEGEINIDLCVATGKIDKKFAKEKLLPLALYIHNDTFWNRLAEQIHVIDEKNIEICPRMGEHVILLGDPGNFEDKLQRVRIFYKNGFPTVGWNKYKAINVAFDGQIVCIKKDKK